MAASVHSAKINEGDKFMEEGEKCLKTGLFKWTPNHDGAAQAFSRAALSYKMGKAYGKAEQAYVRSSRSFLESNSLFYSAKALEDAAGVCKESKRFDQAVSYLKQASDRYRENGNPDTAGMVMEKAAKTMEQSEPAKAAVLYLEVASIHNSEEKYREASNSLRKALNMFIRSERLPDAVDTANKLEQTYQQLQGWQNIHQVVAVKILLQLHNGNVVEANQVYSKAFSIAGFDSSDEAAVIERLLGAFGDGDAEEITKCATDPVFKCMDNDVARFAKSLKPQMMDLNEAPASSTMEELNVPTLQQGDTVTAGSKKLSKEDERAQLFSVSKKKSAPPTQTKTSEDTVAPVQSEEVTPQDVSTPADNDDDEILDIN